MGNRDCCSICFPLLTVELSISPTAAFFKLLTTEHSHSLTTFFFRTSFCFLKELQDMNYLPPHEKNLKVKEEMVQEHVIGLKSAQPCFLMPLL